MIEEIARIVVTDPSADAETGRPVSDLPVSDQAERDLLVSDPPVSAGIVAADPTVNARAMPRQVTGAGRDPIDATDPLSLLRLNSPSDPRPSVSSPDGLIGTPSWLSSPRRSGPWPSVLSREVWQRFVRQSMSRMPG